MKSSRDKGGRGGTFSSRVINLSARFVTCRYQRESLPSTAASFHFPCDNILCIFLNLASLVAPKLNAMLTIIHCTSSGQLCHCPYSRSQSLMAQSTSLSKRCLLLSAVMGVPAGFPNSSSSAVTKCPIPIVSYP